MCLPLAIVPTQTFGNNAITDTKTSEQCENLNSTLAAISEGVARSPFHADDDRDKAVYLTNHATLAIQSWKCHLLRLAYSTPRPGSPGYHRCPQPRNGFHCKRLGNEVLAAEVPRLPSRLVWQAWYILAHISRIPTGRRGPTVARVHPRHPVM